MRHKRVGAQLHCSVFKTLGTEETKKFYTDTHKFLCENKDATVLWNQRAYTDRENVKNKPGVIIYKPGRVSINGMLRGVRINIFTLGKK